MKECNKCARRGCTIMYGIGEDKEGYPKHRTNYKGISTEQFQQSCSYYTPALPWSQTFLEAIIFKNTSPVFKLLDSVGLKLIETKTDPGFKIIAK